MVATCAAGSIIYILPLMLGRTYDMRTDSVGIDIYKPKDIEDAAKNPISNPEVRSSYMAINEMSERRDFLHISGELGLKINSGIMDVKGAGDYMKDTSNTIKKVEILIKISYITQIQKISPDAKPMSYWETRNPDLVGTHVATEIVYGGELFASVNFVAKNEKYVQEIKAQVDGAIQKKGTFDLEAQGKLEMVARNLSSKAKMEIDYFATVPIKDFPATIQGLQDLVDKFKDQVQQVNNGAGVVICVGLRSLSDFNEKFKFEKNKEMQAALNTFSPKFGDLRQAKSMLRDFVSGLPEDVRDDYIKKIMDFSERLSKTLNVFQGIIANLNMEKGSEQLSPAEKAFDENSKFRGFNRYTKECRQLISEYKESENIVKPRAIYTNWGKRTCDNQASNIVYIGFMTSTVEAGIGAGTRYQCLPENPKLTMDFATTGLNTKTSRLAAVRYNSMSMFKNYKQLQDKVVPCVVCETPMRPTVNMFPGMSCPGDWVQEYNGYLASNGHGRMRAENVCINRNPDTYNATEKARGDPILTPVKIGKSQDDKTRKDASITCSVCSK